MKQNNDQNRRMQPHPTVLLCVKKSEAHAFPRMQIKG